MLEEGEEEVGRKLRGEKQMIQGLETEAGRCDQGTGSDLKIHQVAGGKKTV